MLIAGSGVAGLEAALTLRDLGGDRVAISMIAATPQFDYPPMSVLDPFGSAPRPSVDIAAFCDEHGMDLHHGRLTAVDAQLRAATTSTGASLSYDALLIATGCAASSALPGAHRFAGSADALDLADLIAPFEAGQAGRLIFAVTDASAWSLPLYELALLTRHRLAGAQADVLVVTPERDPLQMLGERASDTVQLLLANAHIGVLTEATPRAFADGELQLEDGRRLPADEVVTLPRFTGRPIPGLPQDTDGLLRVDDHARVHRTPGVFAAGDVTAGLPKQGGLAAAQATAAAEAMLAEAGLLQRPAAFEPDLHGVMLTPDVLRDAADPSWQAPAKIAAPRLSAHLHSREPASRHPEQWASRGRIPGEIELH